MASRAEPAAALLLLLLLYCGRAACEYTSTGLSTFVDTMLAEYDREVAPAPRTAVTLALDVRHATVDDASATMRVLADLKMSWVDQRLTWNTSAWEGDSVLVSTERLWAPDVVLLNAGGGEGGGGDGGRALRARLGADGAVHAVRRLDLRVPVALRLEDWPRDEQVAVFKFGSRDHTEDEIDLIVSEYQPSVIAETGAWELVGVEGSPAQLRRGGTGGAAAWAVHVARRGAALDAAASAVLAAAALMLLAAAALPPAQRPPLAACAAFLAAMWLVAAVWHVPRGAGSPRVVRVLCAACAAGAAGGAAAAAAARLARRASAPPAPLRNLLSRVSAFYALAPHPESSDGARSGAWAAAAALLDAAAVAALLVTLAVLLAVHVCS